MNAFRGRLFPNECTLRGATCKKERISMLEEQVQDAQTQSSPKVVFERMIQAANRHDLEAMVACFAPDFRSEQPFYPERNFTGQAGVRKNSSFFFSTMPDFQA